MPLRRVNYDRDADAVWIVLAPGTYERTHELDSRRRVDYDARDRPIHVELLDASKGIDLDGLPQPDEIAAALRQLGIPTLLPAP